MSLKLFLASLIVSLHFGWTSGQIFLPDDPIREDPDRLPIDSPSERDRSQMLDFVENTFATRPKEGETILEAANTNTLGEVPDSSWFTNRIGVEPMSLDELARGPNRGTGPDMSTPWEMIGAKSQGITPGFTIRDGRGDMYFVKFDPLRHPQLATSSEVAVTKFFYAIGYHVPENYLTYVRPDRITISPSARITDATGNKRPVLQRDLEDIFKRVHHRPDGTIQAVASLAVKGSPLGPFMYYETRSDDPNDIFPHQDRRELRGLRVFAAWLNHDDTRSINSLDMFVPDGGKGYVQHYLIDFGSCLGSGSVKPQTKRAGNEYMIEWGPIVRSAASLGLVDRPWRSIKYPKIPGVGRFEGDYFQPELWRPEYPNPAFERARPGDTFWASKIVMKFTDAMIARLISTGKYDNSEAADYLTRTLIKRRDKIVHYYFSLLNPVDGFATRDGRLVFRNLGKDAGLTATASYNYEWSTFDNMKGTSQPLNLRGSADTEAIQLPTSSADFLRLDLRTTSADYPAWNKVVSVYLRNHTVPTVISIEREE